MVVFAFLVLPGARGAAADVAPRAPTFAVAAGDRDVSARSADSRSPTARICRRGRSTCCSPLRSGSLRARDRPRAARAPRRGRARAATCFTLIGLRASADSATSAPPSRRRARQPAGSARRADRRPAASATRPARRSACASANPLDEFATRAGRGSTTSPPVTVLDLLRRFAAYELARRGYAVAPLEAVRTGVPPAPSDSQRCAGASARGRHRGTAHARARSSLHPQRRRAGARAARARARRSRRAARSSGGESRAARSRFQSALTLAEIVAGRRAEDLRRGLAAH